MRLHLVSQCKNDTEVYLLKLIFWKFLFSLFIENKCCVTQLNKRAQSLTFYEGKHFCDFPVYHCENIVFVLFWINSLC